MSESPVRKYRKRIIMTNDEIVDAVVRLVIAEGRNRFTADDLERWSDSGLLMTRTAIMRRFNTGDGRGILRLQHLVAAGLRERGIDPAPLRSLDEKVSRREPLGLPKALVAVSRIAKERGFERPPTWSDIEDFSLRENDVPSLKILSGYYPGLSQAEAIRSLIKDIAAVMEVSAQSIDGRRTSNTGRRPEWTPETMLSSILQVIEDDGLTTLPTSRAMGTYAREGRGAGVSIVQRRYVSESGTGLPALQTDVCIAKGWPPPERLAGRSGLD